MKTKARLFLFLAVTALVTVALVKMARAQTTTTTTPTGPIPVQMDSTRTVAGYSQGVSASWVEVGVDTTVYTDFSFSFGSDYELFQDKRQSEVTLSQRDPWWNFYQVSCPSGGGICQRLDDGSGVARVGDFVFTDTNTATVSVGGFVFSFVADPLFYEMRFGRAEENHFDKGSWCWYQHQNRTRRGQATLNTPNGVVFQTTSGDYSSVWVDWSSEYGEGPSYVPSCAPYSGGGKG